MNPITAFLRGLFERRTSRSSPVFRTDIYDVPEEQGRAILERARASREKSQVRPVANTDQGNVDCDSLSLVEWYVRRKSPFPAWLEEHLSQCEGCAEQLFTARPDHPAISEKMRKKFREVEH